MEIGSMTSHQKPTTDLYAQMVFFFSHSILFYFLRELEKEKESMPFVTR